MLSKEDLAELDCRFNERFVKKDDCFKVQEKLEKILSENQAKFAVIEQQLKTITWLLTAVSGGIITYLIKLLFGMW